jgi:hypothetical protein
MRDGPFSMVPEPDKEPVKEINENGFQEPGAETDIF